MSRRTASRIRGSVVASRSGSCSVSGWLGRPAVMAGLDIRGAAGQQEAVEPVEQCAEIDLRPDRRDQDRQTSGRVDHSIRISVVNPMEDPLVDFTETGWDADERHIADGHQA